MRLIFIRPFACLLSLLLASCANTGRAAGGEGNAGAFVAVSGSSPSTEPAASTPAIAPTPVQEMEMQKPAGQNIGYSSVHVPGPYIAMTFDDGPHGVLTPRLLDLLASRNIKATFFVLGQCAQEHPDVLKRAAAEGHEIANHSWSHPAFSKMSDEGIRSQIERTQQIIQQVTGKAPVLLRPPYGAISARQKEWINKTFGLHVILWSVDPLDWKRPGPAVVTRRIVSETHPGSIILAHDIHEGTVEAMADTLDQLLAKGFKFVTVSQLMAMEVPAPPKPSPTAQPATTGSQTAKSAPHKKKAHH
jgi:peptidoglycan/xylan/chitin deacetylase (PgdA/CDA1 family)